MFKKLCCFPEGEPAIRQPRLLHDKKSEFSANELNAGEIVMTKALNNQSSSYFDLDNLGVSHTKELTTSFIQKEGIDYLDKDAGSLCDICSSRPKTHFVVPCGHSACLPCWTAWLFDDKDVVTKALRGAATLQKLKHNKQKFKPSHKCFACQKPVKTIKRFSYTIVAKHPYEFEEENEALHSGNKSPLRLSNAPDDAKEMETRLEFALESLVRSVLLVKDEIKSNVFGKLEEIRSHLEQLNLNRANDDDRFLVLSVESIAVTESFSNLKNIFIQVSDEPTLWSNLEQALQRFSSVLKSVDSFLSTRVNKLSANVNQTKEVEPTIESVAGTELESVLTDVDVLSQEVNTTVVRESAMAVPSEPNYFLEKNSLVAIQENLSMAISSSGLGSQWDQVTSLLLEISFDKQLVPEVLSFFRNQRFEGVVDAGFIVETISLGESMRTELSGKFEQIVSEVLPLLNQSAETLLEILDS